VVFRHRRQRSRLRQGETNEGGQGPDALASSLPTETAARQAAVGGSPVEMNRLGVILKLKGREDEAAEWFRKAAEAGNHDAMANLANYLMRRGRNKVAAEWFRRAGGPLCEAFAERLSGIVDGDGDPVHRQDR
jgi:TPR repeat protein